MTAGDLTLSLVSHTNIGKTTLARTLLRREVGEVLDQAHITERAERFELIRCDNDVLWLWDTPGFGDSVRLLARLRLQKQPLVWFLRQSWDRLRNRALWSSQQAALNVRRDSDLVLYLVNASEAPDEAGYIASELELLTWIGKPVVVLLNQTGDSTPVPESETHRWRRHLHRWGVVEEVVALDAFSRCWVQESLLFETLSKLMQSEQAARMERLRRAWDLRNLAVFDRSIEHLALYLIEASRDREALASRRPSKLDKQRVMTLLAERLELSTRTLMSALLDEHDLEGDLEVEVERQVDAYIVAGEEKLDPERGALVGGVVSGALGGLAADLMAGGLSIGGGMLAGAILGALGGAGLARGYQLVRGEQTPEIGWSVQFLERLVIQAILRYLAIAHFGRGQGAFEDLGIASYWRERVGTRVRNSADWRAELKKGRNGKVTRLVRRALESVLSDSYPGTERVFARAGRASSSESDAETISRQPAERD